jgi:FAD/FMN-containing dehydrogenase
MPVVFVPYPPVLTLHEREYIDAQTSTVVVACRTPGIGVGGSILHGGFSWLSREYGCTSDPINLLDALVVKLDGTITWASREPDLLWALRGGGAGFTIVVKYRLRAFPYTQRVWAGPILISRKYLPMIARSIAEMSSRNGGRGTHLKLGMFLYLMPKELLGFADAAEDYMVVHAFDARGEETGREEFRWALELPGAIDRTATMNLRQVAHMQEDIAKGKGENNCEWAAMALSEMREDVILRAFDWWDEVNGHEVLKKGAFLVFELFCTVGSLGLRVVHGDGGG